jgi:hypothetical protein
VYRHHRATKARINGVAHRFVNRTIQREAEERAARAAQTDERVLSDRARAVAARPVDLELVSDEDIVEKERSLVNASDRLEEGARSVGRRKGMQRAEHRAAAIRAIAARETVGIVTVGIVTAGMWGRLMLSKVLSPLLGDPREPCRKLLPLLFMHGHGGDLVEKNSRAER